MRGNTHSAIVVLQLLDRAPPAGVPVSVRAFSADGRGLVADEDLVPHGLEQVSLGLRRDSPLVLDPRERSLCPHPGRPTAPAWLPSEVSVECLA